MLRRRKIRKAFEDRVGKREKDRHAYFGALAGVDPARSTAIVDQVRSLLKSAITKSPAAQAQALIKKLEAALPKPAAAAQGVAPTSLVLELGGLKCVEKTIEAFEGKDEIELTVAPVREQDFQPGSQPAPPVKFKLGKFKEGQEKPLSQQLAAFPINANTTFPQGFAAQLFLTEADLLDPRKSGTLVAALLVSFASLTNVAAAIILLFIPALAAPWVFVVWLIATSFALTFPVWVRWLLDDDFEPVNEFLFVNSLADPLPLSESVAVDLLPSDFDFFEGEIRRSGRYRMDLIWKFV